MTESPAADRELGQTSVEYALVVAFVCLLMVGALALSAPAWMVTMATYVSNRI